MNCLKILLLLKTRAGYTTQLPVTHGYLSRLRSPVPGYAWLRKSVTQPGSRLRMVTYLGYAARFPVTHGYVSRLRSPVPGYVWLRNSVTQPGSRLRMVTEVGYAARFPVTHGYVNSQKRCVTDRFHGYARHRVTGYADPWFKHWRTIFLMISSWVFDLTKGLCFCIQDIPNFLQKSGANVQF